jgi:exodeoxyribonuclease VII small subunit
MGYFAGSRYKGQDAPRPRPRAIDMSSKSAKTDQPESFEAALAELEKIVASMESGKLTLEQSLAAHKRGLELAQYCQGILARAQQQVKVLEENTLKNLPGADDE